MALDKFKAPRLPMPPPGPLEVPYLVQLIRTIEIYFSQLDSKAANNASKYTADEIISGTLTTSGTLTASTTIELGHATDTTLARVSAGVISIEGNVIYRAGGTDVPVTDGGTGRSTSTTAYGLIAAGTTATGAHQTLAAGATTEVLVGGGAAALPVWTTATGSGAPVRATSPSLTTPTLASYTVAGVPSASPAGQLAYISNEIGGAVVAFSDNTNWRRVTDRAIIA